jgi:hypothetical protein
MAILLIKRSLTSHLELEVHLLQLFLRLLVLLKDLVLASREGFATKWINLNERLIRIYFPAVDLTDIVLKFQLLVALCVVRRHDTDE